MMLTYTDSLPQSEPYMQSSPIHKPQTHLKIPEAPRLAAATWTSSTFSCKGTASQQVRVGCRINKACLVPWHVRTFQVHVVCWVPPHSPCCASLSSPRNHHHIIFTLIVVSPSSITVLITVTTLARASTVVGITTAASKRHTPKPTSSHK